MGALAGLLAAARHEVRGSDGPLYPPMSDQIAALGIPVFAGFAAANLAWGPERVVVGNTCKKDNVEVAEAERLGLPLASLPGVLGELLADRHSVVVAGTHGKTTTASLLAQIFTDAGRDPGFLIGGVPIGFGRGWRHGLGGVFIVEGDEYDSAFFDKGAKFLHYRPRTAILTSVELDHVDIFATLDDVRATFRAFVELLPEDGLLVVAAASPEALAIAEWARCRVETYAFGDRAVTDGPPTWQGDSLDILRGGRCSFELAREGERFGRFETSLFGEYNLENIIAAIAVAHAHGVPAASARGSVTGFAGVRRRQEIRGLARGVLVVDDYAHHPTAIDETLKGLRQRFPGQRLLAVFEPRTATSRRKTFQDELVDALVHADGAVIARLYDPARIPADERLDPARLAMDLRARGTQAAYIDNVNGIVAHAVDWARPGDVVVVFSTGAFDGLHDRLLDELGDAILPAAPTDLAAIRAILNRVSLDSRDIRDQDYGNFLVVRNESGVVGCIGVEVYGQDAILRSLAVNLESRGAGYGWMLADTAVTTARHRGVKRMYLLTPKTESDFFAEKLGFRVIDRSTVAEAVAKSSTFRHELGRSPMTMRLDL
jgi:UDP-N-acetylmuramate: L-alanyl-gamma-D-glutamyl-meso-diaminopimelate ligase